MNGSLLVAGTGSDVGKSVVVQGLCRYLVRRGVRVAPFKAQNMSLNSYVTGEGAEIARAQAAQASAARIAPEAVMNPVLLKPIDDRRSQVIVMGRAVCDTDAQEYRALRPSLARIVLDALEDLRSRYEVVICEGAGSLAEINLREFDLANMGLARAAGLPVLLVGDIDRGGVFASLYGSVALLEPEDRSLIAGFIVNKFRGDADILEPGLRMIERLTNVPFLGVMPWLPGLWMDAEDAVSIAAIGRAPAPPIANDTLDVAVVALRHVSNFTDIDPIACEPGVTVRFTRSHADLLRADLVILPGSKATVNDFGEIRRDGLDAVIIERAGRGLPVLGICGGYQMLGTRIADRFESERGDVGALGLLPVDTTFEHEKILARPIGSAPRFGGAAVEGYEIHHGRVRRRGGTALFETPGEDEGCVAGSVFGTSWHGVFENDDFRRGFLREIAARCGRDWRPGPARFGAIRESTFERLADAIEEHLETRTLDAMLAPRAASIGPASG